MAKSIANKKTAAKGKSAKPASKTAKSAKTKRPSGKDRPIKYEDKSAGQPELVPIFQQLKKLIGIYAKGHLIERDDKPGQYSVWSDKTVEAAGRIWDDIYFAGILVQKGYVGLYFMPVYADPSLKAQIHPQLLKCLKGKSCFHIRKNDPELMQQIKEALKIGYEDFTRKGWV